MARRIVLYGATGYTGRLVAAALSRAKRRPVLAGRSGQNLAALGVRLGHGLETRVADPHRPETLLALIEPGDVFVSTAGPFSKFGTPIVEAAIEKRATYLDSSGEPNFIRSVFETLGPVAAEAGVALVPATAFEYIAGNFAAWKALQAAGEEAARVDVGYFIGGPLRRVASAGTMASAGAAAMEPHFAWRGGELVTVPAGDVLQPFMVDGIHRPGMAFGGSEHLTLPKLFPALTNVGVYVGGPKSERLARMVGRFAARAPKVPGLAPTVRWLTSLPRNREGPSEDERTRFGCLVIAIAYDGSGRELRTVRLSGTNPYTFTGDFLAWAAMQVADHGVVGQGALGPVEAFGSGPLAAGVGKAGLSEL